MSTLKAQPRLYSSRESILTLKAHLSGKQAKIPKNPTMEDYITYIKKLSNRLKQGPLDFWIPNVFRRLIQVIRLMSSEDGFFPIKDKEKNFKELGLTILRKSIRSKTTVETGSETGSNAIQQDVILPSIEQVLEELEAHSDDINTFASTHFFTNEVLLVYEYSTTVLNFLLSAKKTRNFEIIVLESETENLGKQFATDLGKHNLNVTLTPFTNAYAIMQRVNKTLLGVDAILKNGGLLMHPGTYAICVLAKQFAVPVIVLSGAHKLTPKYAFDQTTFNQLVSPLKINPNSTIDQMSIGITFDYVPPEYISLYITNQGQYTPQSIYQLFSDFYNVKDEDI
ncbi:unnamed protein product [Paramecium primaurelia]|uniref:Translation initiation factor eIF-2B subunit beta n=1 Tax=Paramecium primaurelia TaxID=5886 RepID=A0A8S1MVD6_PARPR|nr:unnamed protein product [Paramecium primaurelia]